MVNSLLWIVLLYSHGMAHCGAPGRESCTHGVPFLAPTRGKGGHAESRLASAADAGTFAFDGIQTRRRYESNVREHARTVRRIAAARPGHPRSPGEKNHTTASRGEKDT